MLDKLEAIFQRYKNVEEMISQPDILADMKRFTHLNREYKGLTAIINKYHEYKNIVNNIENAKDLLKTEKDADMREMAKAELDELEPKVQPIEEEIRILLIPKEPEDAKNATVEIRGGTGSVFICRGVVQNVFKVLRKQRLENRNTRFYGRFGRWLQGNCNGSEW
jgi:peptide chain release factor 1